MIGSKLPRKIEVRHNSQSTLLQVKIQYSVFTNTIFVNVYGKMRKSVNRIMQMVCTIIGYYGGILIGVMGVLLLHRHVKFVSEIRVNKIHFFGRDF